MTKQSLKQSAKDVLTLKTFKENFFTNDGTISSFLAHGTNEFANVWLHGQPAPIYAGANSPALNVIDTHSLTWQPLEASAPALEQSQGVEQAPEQSVLDQAMNDLYQSAHIQEPEKEMTP